MKKLRAIISIILVIALTFVLCACGQNETETGDGAASADEEFVIGSFLQLTGAGAVYGAEAQSSIETAIEYVNANGGFNGAMARLVVYDTQGSPEEAVKCITKLINTDKVNAIIGSVNSGEVLAAAGYANDAHIYTFGLGTSATWMNQGWEYVFRATLNYDRGVPLTVNMLKEVNYKTVGVINGQDDASVSVSDTFIAACEEAGVEVIAHESFDAGDTDFSAQINTVLAADPDCLYLATVGDTQGSMCKQIRQAGYGGIIFNKEVMQTSFAEVAGENNAQYVAAAYPYVTYASIDDCDVPAMKAYLELYQEHTGKIPTSDSGYRGWDTVIAMWEASKIAGSNDSDALCEATNKVVFEGLGGTLDYTKGDHEGYSSCNTFIFYNGKNILWSDWIANGGYDEMIANTGRTR